LHINLANWSAKEQHNKKEKMEKKSMSIIRNIYKLHINEGSLFVALPKGNKLHIGVGFGLNLLCVTKLTSNTIKINKVTYTCENVHIYIFSCYKLI
jgi:hypothetical protein